MVGDWCIHNRCCDCHSIIHNVIGFLVVHSNVTVVVFVDGGGDGMCVSCIQLEAHILEKREGLL